jgi:hypothetical protein
MLVSGLSLDVDVGVPDPDILEPELATPLVDDINAVTPVGIPLVD